jgi:hypothetical protein
MLAFSALSKTETYDLSNSLVCQLTTSLALLLTHCQSPSHHALASCQRPLTHTQKNLILILISITPHTLWGVPIHPVIPIRTAISIIIRMLPRLRLQAIHRWSQRVTIMGVAMC